MRVLLRIHPAIAFWIRSYFDNVMTKFIINNRTDVWKADVNLLIWEESCVKSLNLGLLRLVIQTVVCERAHGEDGKKFCEREKEEWAKQSRQDWGDCRLCVWCTYSPAQLRQASFYGY